MCLPWDDIHALEVAEDYPAAIDALESRLSQNPAETEAIIRLGFNLWYAVVEDTRMGKRLPTAQYAQRFMDLLHQYHESLQSNADFCWAFGQGIHLFWHELSGATEQLGQSLINRACALDSFWARFWTDVSDFEAGERLKDRGILANYYNVR
jgi:hypothetical protein